MAQGLIRRAAGLVALMVIALGVSAADASAQMLVTPTIVGNGTVTTTGYSCALIVAPNTDPTNSSSRACPAANITDTQVCFVSTGGVCNVWRYTPKGPVTATPATGWQFVSWAGCDSAANAPACTFSSPRYGGAPLVLPAVATFREIVAVAGGGVPEDFAFSPDFTSVKRPRVSFATQVQGSVYRCEVRNASNNAVVQAKGPLCTSPFAPSADLPDGKYTYNVWAYHNNDESITPFSKTFTVDTVAPATALDVLTGPQEGSLLTIGTATFAFSSNEGGSFECSLDGAPFSPCASPVAYSGLAGGVHGFAVRALDAAGNLDAVGKARSWTIFVPPAPIIITTPGSTNPEQINATLAYGFDVKGSSTRLGSLSVKNVPFGSTVTVTCAAGTCPAALYKKVKGKKVKQALVISKAFGTVSLKKLVSKPLKAGTVLEILVSKPGAIGAVKRLTIRKGKKPVLSSRCLPPGAKKSVAC